MPIVYVVDDDDAVRLSLKMLLGAAGHEVRDYDSAESFLAAYDPDVAGAMVLDVRMPGYSGLELQAQLERLGPHAPIIFLSGHGDVPTAARAMRGGAIDFLEKPFDTDVLLARLDDALASDKERRSDQARRDESHQRLALLTPREREVIEHVGKGSANKVVAADLGISERTVELHRARGLKKLGLRTVADLTAFLLSHHS
jgi:two-component system response regulator FixJ